MQGERGGLVGKLVIKVPNHDHRIRIDTPAGPVYISPAHREKRLAIEAPASLNVEREYRDQFGIWRQAREKPSESPRQ
jgi:hypothetical protein